MSKKILTAYFSATGTTAQAAKEVAEAAGADLYAITPERPYSKEDLNWMNKKSRSSLEMADPTSRPALKGRVEGMEGYEVILLGFPIWWYKAPTLINTFLEAYDLKGKTIVPFATSGGSGMGNTNAALRGSCPGAALAEGKILNGAGKNEVKKWLASLKL